MTPASPTHRTQAERRAKTERRVLEATMTIIAEHGVHAVTAASVGEAAGYSRGIVNHQFGTRQALLAVVAKTVQSRFDPDPDGRHGREHVLTLVARYLSSLESEPRDIRVFLRLMTAAISGEEPGLQAVFVQRDEHFRQHLAVALADGQHDQSIRADVHPMAAAAAIVGQLRGIALQLQLAPDLIELDTLLVETVQLIDRALRPQEW
jgi:AcrR family transcriptional regulator